jgi:hypothetical protein
VAPVTKLTDIQIKGARHMTRIVQITRAEREFEVQRNIPIPAGSDGRGRKSIFPLSEMQVGDSFAAGSSIEARERVSRAVDHHQRRHGTKFTVRKQPDGSYRCWRIA